MKTISVICILAMIVACVHSKPSEEMRRMVDECREEVGLPEKSPGPHGPPNLDDPKTKCFSACLKKKKGEMVDGKIDLEKVLEFHSRMFPNAPENSKETITDCVETANKESDECEVAGSIMKCMMDKFGSTHHHHKD